MFIKRFRFLFSVHVRKSKPTFNNSSLFVFLFFWSYIYYFRKLEEKAESRKLEASPDKAMSLYIKGQTSTVVAGQLPSSESILAHKSNFSLCCLLRSVQPAAV